MREKDLKEDLATMAYKAEADHEVQMARADLYKIAKYSIKLHEMIKTISEEQGIEGWVQSKITKAADYMGSVYHHLDYEMKFDEMTESKKAKPDYIDIDGDDNKTEPMKKAVKDKEKKKKKTKESTNVVDQFIIELHSKGYSVDQISEVLPVLLEKATPVDDDDPRYADDENLPKNKKKKGATPVDDDDPRYKDDENLPKNKKKKSAKDIDPKTGKRKLKANKDKDTMAGGTSLSKFLGRKPSDPDPSVLPKGVLSPSGLFGGTNDTSKAGASQRGFGIIDDSIVHELTGLGYSPDQITELLTTAVGMGAKLGSKALGGAAKLGAKALGGAAKTVGKVATAPVKLATKAVGTGAKAVGKAVKTAGNTAAKTVGLTSSIDDIYANRLEGMLETKLASKRKFQTLEESVGKAISEEEFDALAEKQDACYHKVKSRYKVWPSAYASGALVQCRKKGAKNWGNKSK